MIGYINHLDVRMSYESTLVSGSNAAEMLSACLLLRLLAVITGILISSPTISGGGRYIGLCNLRGCRKIEGYIVGTSRFENIMSVIHLTTGVEVVYRVEIVEFVAGDGCTGSRCQIPSTCR